jgi:hypothetical protein
VGLEVTATVAPLSSNGTRLQTRMYMPFMTMFEGWKDKEDTRRLTSIEALVEQLPTMEEYWNDLRECRVVKWLMQTMSNMLFRKH